MRWVGIATAIASLVAMAYVLIRRAKAASAPPSDVASYAEIKRRIRSGDVPESAAPVRLRPAPPPKPVDEIFRVRGHAFGSALLDRVASKAQRAGEGTLTASEAAVLYVWALEGEVNNGGFDQYFFNSSGDQVREALSGLELIGARRTAAIVRRAMALFGEAGPSPVRETRWQQMDRWTSSDKKVLERLDDEFYSYPDPIADLLEQHCRTHRSEFER